MAQIKTITGSGIFDYAPVGRIHYTVRPTARRITARWRAGAVYMSLPPRLETSMLLNALSEMTPAILRHRPTEAFYNIGDTVDTGDLKITISARAEHTGRVVARQLKAREFAVEVDHDVDFTDRNAVIAVSDAMKHIARFVAPDILLPRARAIAEAVDRRPLAWEISRGLHTLGRCNSRGVIALSCVCVFLPADLRDYIICHELAHLSEMNHSAAFHQICDRYCGGLERQLQMRLRRFKFPVVK